MRGARLSLRMARATTRRMSTMPTTAQRFGSSLEWVKAGCPSPMSAAAPAAAKIKMPGLPPAMVAFAIESGPQYVLSAACVVALAQYSMFDPIKSDSNYIIVEGRLEKKPEEDEDEEEDDGPSEFAMPDDGKRYGGAFVAREDLLKAYEDKSAKH